MCESCNYLAGSYNNYKKKRLHLCCSLIYKKKKVTTNAVRPTKIFITAEDDADIQYPGDASCIINE
jgi:hypothetical protein